ncbi:hypothetical protein [Nitrosomonas sp. PY1]|nr:hypothetical protein [Nitrosomonas sp. PY1]
MEPIELIKDLFVAATLAFSALGIGLAIVYVLTKFFGFKRRKK